MKAVTILRLHTSAGFLPSIAIADSQTFQRRKNNNWRHRIAEEIMHGRHAQGENCTFTGRFYIIV